MRSPSMATNARSTGARPVPSISRSTTRRRASLTAIRPELREPLWASLSPGAWRRYYGDYGGASDPVKRPTERTPACDDSPACPGAAWFSGAAYGQEGRAPEGKDAGKKERKQP